MDSLPGVPGGASFLGTFDREEAVEDETLDFFAAGHPLVEGILADLEESPRGRVAVLQSTIGDEKGFGLLAFYKDGPVFEVVVLDELGERQPEWGEAIARHPLRARRARHDLLRDADWGETIRRLGALLDPARRPVALAALFIGT